MSLAVPRLCLATAALALALPATALAAAPPDATTTARSTPHTVPTFPVPASARVHPTTTPTAPATTTPTTSAGATPTTPGGAAAGGTSAPSAGATSPTTTTPQVPTTPTTVAPGGVGKPLDSGAANARARVRAHSDDSGHVSTEAIVLAAIAALLLLACAAWAFARSRAYEPHWLLSLRHAMAEAGFRTSATWAEFSDWIRLGH